MPRPHRDAWRPMHVGSRRLEVMNLDHPDHARRVMDDMSSGTDVYYDRRWEVTERLCRLLLVDHPDLLRDRAVLIVGAGVGLETVAAGLLARRLVLNDTSAVALELCAAQLRRNDIHTFELLPGACETLTVPAVDLAIACFVVYNRPTAAAIHTLLHRVPAPVLLANEALPDWRRLLARLQRPHRSLTPPDDSGMECLLFDALPPPAPPHAARSG